MNDVFDRCIDLTFYNEEGQLISYLGCPPDAQKPEIVVEGTLLTINCTISTLVTITNLERDFPIYDVYYIKANLYYKNALVPVEKKGMELLLYSEWADQIKGPPDRQVQFHCLRASMSPTLLGTQISFLKGFYDDKTKKSVANTFDNFLKQLIIEYNKSVDSTCKGVVREWCQLNSTPLYKGIANKLADKEVIVGATEATLIEFIDKASDLIKDVINNPAYELSDIDKKRLSKCLVLIEDKTLVVMPSVLEQDATEQYQPSNIITLSHAVSLWRKGNIVHLRSLFDPRIKHSVKLQVPTYNLGGKQSLSRQVTVPGDMVGFVPVAGIQFKFGTVEQNSMDIMGVI